MPITRSAKKALRQSLRRRARNRKRKAAFQRLAKEVQRLAEAKRGKEALKLLPQLYKALDKAAKENVIKPKKAARLKSRLTKLVRKNSP